jgi:RNA polymerase sigma-70 factor (ECF subfamily)
MADTHPTPERQVLQAATRDEVWQAIQSLSQPLKEALLLRYWADYTFQEIAQILDCPLRTAQSRVRLAHERLAAILGAEDILPITERVL